MDKHLTYNRSHDSPRKIMITSASAQKRFLGFITTMADRRAHLDAENVLGQAESLGLPSPLLELM
jgi:hypothetical protein